MRVSRREFLTTSAAFAILPGTAARSLAAHDRHQNAQAGPRERFDPWVEVLPDALAHNVRTIRQLGGRPILAVIKNHGYGLDFRIVARLLDPNPDVAGFALVRAEDALALREAGISKPILLMARAPDNAIAELAARRVTLSVYADDDPSRMTATRSQMPIEVHAYVDTGMSRMGIAYHRALPSSARWRRRRPFDSPAPS
jgi:alanine racemase